MNIECNKHNKVGFINKRGVAFVYCFAVESVFSADFHSLSIFVDFMGPVLIRAPKLEYQIERQQLTDLYGNL